MTADNLDELDDMYGETDENDTTWNFRSYWYTNKKTECLEYEQGMPEVKVIGQRLPNLLLYLTVMLAAAEVEVFLRSILKTEKMRAKITPATTLTMIWIVGSKECLI
ncbi:MAG: hypothetical protein OXG88_08050 [Gammaproteobacteria bacterium]|nr:hypothetical protein [Gammaproteobacteria bacterium]